MTIKTLEERTGLSRSNIRFMKGKTYWAFEKWSNGYRDYSENDVENIKKIAYLRTLGISIEDIRSIISEKSNIAGNAWEAKGSIKKSDYWFE